MIVLGRTEKLMEKWEEEGRETVEAAALLDLCPRDGYVSWRLQYGQVTQV